MEIYFHTGILENPVPLINYLWEKYSLHQQIDKKFGGYITYLGPQGVEINFNSQYIRLKDSCPFESINEKKTVPESSPLRPLLEDLIKQFGPKRKFVTVVGEAVEVAWLMKDLLPSKDVQSEQ
ncbi:hypothetical protein J4417_03880 [Candidatus Woesearchaeota archaeon]|nr:hypothetical protein [Candidatus Woesearchaeota archaeon]